MTFPVKLYSLFGAGVVSLICAATALLLHYHNEKKRGMLKDIARLNMEMSIVRKELNQLLNHQKTFKINKRGKVGKPNNSFISSASTTDEYVSAVSDLDSSDLEFYDVSDDEKEIPLLLEVALKNIDMKLDEGNPIELEGCIDKLKDLCIDYPENPQLLWRIAKAHYKIFEQTDDEVIRQDNINKGIEACEAALNLKPKLSQVHKWYSILLGVRLDYRSIKDKLGDSKVFKDHLDRAVALNPTDPVLHHMLGQFAYQLSSLKWYEKKVMTALNPNCANLTYLEALRYCLEAEKLLENDWKDNKLLIAKIKLGLGEIDEAIEWLEKAQSIPGNEENKVHTEIVELLKQYKTSR